jgi:predicted phage baseplate assembly protein
VSKEARISKGTVVSSSASADEVHFETTEDITAVPLKIRKIIVDDGTGVSDQTAANDNPDQFFAPFGQQPRAGCALYLGFDKFSDALSCMSFMCYMYEGDLIPAGKHGGEADFEFVSARLRWEIYDESEAMNWRLIVPAADGTRGFKQTGRLVFEGIGQWDDTHDIRIWTDPQKRSYLWLRCRVGKAAYEYPPRIETVRLNTVPAAHGLTVTDDSKDRISNGLPHQAFTLTHAPVLPGTLEIEIGGETWQERDDLDGSGPNDTHFVLEGQGGTFSFGDGQMGRIPPRGSKIRVVSYRTGGGDEGNIGAQRKWSAEGIDVILGVVNHKPATGGANGETVADATARFLRDLGTPYPAVTSADFEYLAVNTPGLRVAKAKAVANYHPDRLDGTGCVTIAVIPFTPILALDRPPEPSRGFKKAICDHLNKHRLLGAEIAVVSPVYVRIDANTEVTALGGFSTEALASKIRERLREFLHPIRGWGDKKGWPIGRNVYRSEICEMIEEIDGVECVTRLLLAGDSGSRLDADGNVRLPSKAATVYSGSHTINVIRPTDQCRREDPADG